MWADCLPVVLFFVVYKVWGIFAATLAAISASALQVGLHWLKGKRVTGMQYATLFLLLILGGTTLWLQDETYIKWKPTLIYWLFSLAFLLSPFFAKKKLVETLLDEKIKLPPSIWAILNTAWGLFFGLLGCLNIYVLKNFSTEQWVNFKLFGGLGLTIAFVLVQGIFLGKYLKE